jgi:hypothetical protein
MLSLTVIAWLGVFAALFAFWWKSDEVKNYALKHARKQCKELNLQFLDQSMALKNLWPMRNQVGSLSLRRIYQFEFSSTGEQRYAGQVTMLGVKLEGIEMEPHVLP